MKPLGSLIFGLVFGGIGMFFLLQTSRHQSFGLAQIVPGIFVFVAVL